MQNYRRLHSQPVEDAAAARDTEDAASVAWHTFQAAFRNQPMLTEAFLLEGEEQTILDTFSSWIDRSAPREYLLASGTSYIYSERFATRAKCSDLLMHLTSEPSNRIARSSWPYVKSVKYDFRHGTLQLLLILQSVFLQAYILSKGLILVDLPGK